jgi:hypothetical protein
MRLIGLILVLLMHSARAEILLDDHFSYADGVLQETSMAKWVGHSGETNQVDVTDGAVNLTGKEAQDVNALLLNGPFTSAGGAVLYVAFKINFSALPTKTGGYFIHFKNSSATGFRGRIWSTLTADKKINLGITSATSSDPVLFPRSLELNTEYQIIARLDVATSLTTLWIDPITEQDMSVQSDAGAALAITSLALRQASGIGIMRIDDLVVATTFDELQPASQGVPRVVRSPENATVIAGMSVSFSIEAAGSEPLLYQWYFKNGELQNATNSTYTITETTEPDAGDYKVKVSNSAGSVWSGVATLSVKPAPLPPQIVRQPENSTIDLGESAQFEVIATGTEPLLYQWYFNGVRLLVETNSNLSLSNPEIDASGEYKVTISNSAGIAFSGVALLAVREPQYAPSIVDQPFGLTVTEGESAEFSVNATGTLPLQFQWLFNGNELNDETNSALHLLQVTKANEGSFQVRITNQKGSVTSAAAYLEVIPPVVPDPPAITFTNYFSQLVRPGDLATNTFTEIALQPGENFRMDIGIKDSGGRTLSVSLNTNELPAEAQWSTSLKTPTTLSGTFEFDPGAASAGQNYLFRIEARDSETTNQIVWSFHVLSPKEQNVVITEFLSNPESSPFSRYFNPLQRFVPSSTPESEDVYVEITNFSADPVDIGGWALSDSTNVWHEFTDGSVLDPWKTAIVYGGSASGSEPVIDTISIPANDPNFISEDGFGGTLRLLNAEGKLISRIIYSAPNSHSSMTRYPDVNGAFTPQEAIGTNLFSPGRNWNGEPFGKVVEPVIVGDIRIESSDAGQVRLSWQARPGQTYTVLRTASINEPFMAITPQLQFTTDTGEFSDSINITGALFYRLESP